MKNTLLTGGSTFAHLLGRGKPAEPKKAELVDDNELIETHTDPDDVDDEMDPKKKKKTQDIETDRETTDETLDNTEDKETGRSDAKLPGEDQDDEDRKDAKASAARGRERARCARIFGCAAAGRRPDVAAHLAFGTDMNASAVIATLRAVVQGESRVSASAARETGSDLRARMRQEPRIEVGTEGERKAVGGVETFAAKMKLADEKRRGLA